MKQDHGHSLDEIRARISEPLVVGHLRDAVYGGIDGAVTTFAIVAGVAGAGLSDTIIIVLGMANVLADGFSMAAANYSATKSDLENLERLRAIETRHIEQFPDGERLELQEILRHKGLSGKTLQDATDAITQNKQAWIDLMLVEEYGISPVDPAPLRAAVTTFVAFLAAGLVPLVPFIAGVPDPFTASIAATLVVFFTIGALKSRWSMSTWWRSGGETLAIGAVAAVIAYLAGSLFRAS